MQDLLLQNQKLMALVAKMRGGDEDDKTPKAKIPPRRKSRSITKPLRRSPRRHAASPAASPRTPAADGAALRKRLSFGGGGGGKKSPYGGIGKKKNGHRLRRNCDSFAKRWVTRSKPTWTVCCSRSFFGMSAVFSNSMSLKNTLCQLWKCLKMTKKLTRALYQGNNCSGSQSTSRKNVNATHHAKTNSI